MRLALALFLAASLLAVPLLAQTPRYQEELTVAEVSLDLNVTDRDGDPVQGLRAEDFEVLEDGKPVAVTFFREYDATRASAQSAAAGAGEPRTAFFFIDNADIGQAVRTRFFDALQESAVDMMSRGVEVVFLLWSDQLLLIRPEDAETAVHVLEKWETDSTLMTRSAAGDRFRSRALSIDGPDLGLTQTISDTRRFHLFAAVEAATKIVAQASGRRILILASRGFAVPVPRFDTTAEEAARRSFADHPLAARRSRGAIEIPTRGETAVGYSLEDGIAAVANRYGVPIYGLFSGGLSAAAHSADTTELHAPRPFSESSALVNLPRDVGSLADIAARTGGLALGATSVFDPFLDRVETDLAHYYTIAYRSAAELRFRKLEVRPKNRDWSVRHREATVPDDEPLRR